MRTADNGMPEQLQAAETRLPPHWLILAAAVVLTLFHYFNRADTIGVLRGGGGWLPLTRTPVAGWLHYVGAALLLGVVPVVLAVATRAARLGELGLGIGRAREASRWLLVGIPLAIVAGRIAAASPMMRDVYPLDPGVSASLAAFVPYALLEFLYYGAWEVLFRGVLLFGLAPSTGASAANVVQTALSVTAHFGRPLVEAMSALPAGILFGWLSLRLRSIWYVALIHWLTGVSMDWWILSAAPH
jgi:membrane protease YdiL (CAAX protease family)